MKKISITQVIKVALVMVVVGMSWLSYENLPEKMPVHWNFIGEVDNYWPKERAILLTPTVSILMLLGFAILPQLDPNKKKYRLFQNEWEIIQIGLLGFMAFVGWVALDAAMHPDLNVGTMIMAGIGALFILLGNYLSKIRQNWFIGIKTPWTLASEENWNKTHRFASWCFVGAGITIMLGTAAGLMMPPLLTGTILVAGLLPVLYSFLYFKKKEKLMRRILGGVVAGLILLGMMRLVAGEDSWMCVDGKWVAHGHPSSPVPIEECR